ncbi:MAG TPA: peptidase M3, partial [Paracoccus sp. (in: a-proteobacteria)]|nr:peptidase M3 [Paracoccus sp. (in: a-proteobacteria)]
MTLGTPIVPNPELTHWTGPHGLPRFDRIADADILPAVQSALADSRAAHEGIATDPAAPDFANTVGALESADEALERVAAVFFTLAATCSTPARESIQRELAPLLSAHSAAILTDPRLLARVESVWDGRDDLTPEQARVTELTRRTFLRGGAGLDDAGRARMAEIGSRLATLCTQFQQNLLRDEREFALAVQDDCMGGIPGWLAGAMRQAAAERGLPGQVVTVSRSLLVPFLEHA